MPLYVIGFADPELTETLAEVAAAGCGPSCNRTGCTGVPLTPNNEDELAMALAEVLDAQQVSGCAEDAASCPGDCAGCNSDGVCDGGEDACCAADACADSCGDGCCTGAKDATACPADC